MKYRMLKKGEYLRDGDETMDSAGWCKIYINHLIVMDGTYRRPVRERCRHVSTCSAITHGETLCAYWCKSCGALRMGNETKWQRCRNDKECGK